MKKGQAFKQAKIVGRWNSNNIIDCILLIVYCLILLIILLSSETGA